MLNAGADHVLNKVSWPFLLTLFCFVWLLNYDEILILEDSYIIRNLKPCIKHILFLLISIS
jgi:hypothetical protein